MKKCSKCGIEKDYIFFGKRKASKDGLSYICKECKSKIDKEYSKNNKEDISERLKDYYLNNKEVIIERSRDYYLNNKEDIGERFKEYYLKNKETIIESSKDYYFENKEEIKRKRKTDYNKYPTKYKTKTKNYYYNNKEKSLEYAKDYRRNNIKSIKQYKINYYLNNKAHINEYMRNYWNNKKYIKSWRSLLYRYFKFFTKKKNESTLSLLRYTPEMLRMRIECQFKDGMSWDNYGDWEIDHKKPLSKFTIDTKPHIVNSLCNLQPLWKDENRFKSNKWK